MNSLSNKAQLRVLVVDDSASARELLIGLFQAEPDIVIVGVAKDGEEAVRLAAELRPDVTTMDVHMPKLNGFEATQQIMRQNPHPVIIVSGSLDTTEVQVGFLAVEAGAVAVLQRPHGPTHPAFSEEARLIVRTVRSMAEVKVVRRWSPDERRTSPLPALDKTEREHKAIKVVAIGASTGGPLALQALLNALPADLPFPLLVVQHMTKGFTPGLVEWLARGAKVPVRIAADREVACAGHVYFAPDGAHLGITSDGRLQLLSLPPENGLCPSVNVLFRSVRESYGANVAAVLLTGMGVDGVAELKRLREIGALTIAQDQESSVVFGMPGEAVRQKAARWILPPDQIARLIVRLSLLDQS